MECFFAILYCTEITGDFDPTSSQFCTGQVKDVLEEAFKAEGYTESQAYNTVAKIMPNSIPLTTPTSLKDATKAGFKRIETFKKDKDGNMEVTVESTGNGSHGTGSGKGGSGGFGAVINGNGRGGFNLVVSNDDGTLSVTPCNSDGDLTGNPVSNGGGNSGGNKSGGSNSGGNNGGGNNNGGGRTAPAQPPAK